MLHSSINSGVYAFKYDVARLTADVLNELAFFGK